MNEVNNTPLQQASFEYSQINDWSAGRDSLAMAFETGAQWQKEQLKELIEAAKKILNHYWPNSYDPGHKYCKILKEEIEKFNSH